MNDQYVLISGQYKRLTKRLEEIQKDLKLEIVQINSPRIYFEIDAQVTNPIRQVKDKMREDESIYNIFFQIFPVIDGKIDYVPYMSMETKKAKYKYYK